MVALPLPNLPETISALPKVLALDLRWTWSHEGDALWERVDEQLWRRTRIHRAFYKTLLRSTIGFRCDFP